MIEKLDRHSPVLYWLLDYIEERIQSDKQWKVANEIKNFGRDIFNEEYVEIPNLFGDNIIGSRIVNVSFEHKEIVDGTTHYGQPTIVISLDSGKELKFTHNFGEHNGDKVQSSFVVVQ